MSKLASHCKALRSNKSVPQLKLIEPTTTLTRQQKRIVLLIMDGWSDQKISQFLFLSERTVDSHVRNICKLLNIRNRIEIIVHVLANPHLIDSKKSEEHKVNKEICILKEQRLKAAWALSNLISEIHSLSIKQKLTEIIQILQPESNHLKVFWGDGCARRS